MVSDNSSNEEIFNRSRAIPSEALKSSGCRTDLQYIPSNRAEKQRKRKWKRGQLTGVLCLHRAWEEGTPG